MTQLRLVEHYRHAAAGAQTSPPHQQDVMRDLVASAGVALPVGRVLDLGSGRGANLATLLGWADLVVAADVSEEALQDSASRLAPRDRARVGYVTLPGDRLPFADGAFDLVVCTEVLEHVPDLEVTTRELQRVTRPGGLLLVSTPNYRNVMGLKKAWMDWRSGRHDWDPWHAHAGGLERFMTSGRLVRAFRGCSVVALRGADYASALAISSPPLRRRLNRFLLLAPGQSRLSAGFGMQVYALLRKP